MAGAWCCRAATTSAHRGVTVHSCGQWARRAVLPAVDSRSHRTLQETCCARRYVLGAQGAH